MTSDGFVSITPSKDSRVIYVSTSSGDDHNNGLSSKHPVRTIKHAKTLMRDGMPDEMLLKCGDVFDASFGHWTKSGRSSDEPMVLGSYGKGDRPLLNTGVSQGFATYSGHPINNIVITGIHFEASGYTGSNGGYQTSGIQLLRQGEGYLVQDVLIDGYKDNIVLQGDGTGVSSFILRRSIITNAYNTGKVGNGHAQGLYASGTTSHLMIEQNVFDHNGWKEGVAAPTDFNHNIYVNTGATNVTVRNNIIARASLNGVLLRSGGTIADNLFLRNPVAAVVDHTASTITGNVVLEGTDNAAHTLSVAFNIEGVPSAVIANNIIAHDKGVSKYGRSGISINWAAKNVTVENNTIYDWRNAIVNNGMSGIVIRNNVLSETNPSDPVIQQQSVFSKSLYTYSNNMYSAKGSNPFRLQGGGKSFKKFTKAVRENDALWQGVDYSSPKRNLAKYNAKLGGKGTIAAFLAAARAQSAKQWDLNYTAAASAAYIRTGFNIDTPLQTVNLKLSPSASFVTTTDAGIHPTSVTTEVLAEPGKGKKKKKKPKSGSGAPLPQPEAQTVVASKDDSNKKDKQPFGSFQMKLIAMIAGLW
jgi:hypothetical protein